MVDIAKNMTIAELQALVEQVVEQKLATYPWYTSSDKRSPAQVLESTWKNIIKAEPGAPSALELLREEREQWYKPT